MNDSFAFPFLFHHCIPADRVQYRTLLPDRTLSSREFRPAYDWLEETIGFFPFFFSVGCDETAIRMTGYDDNWRIWKGCRTIRGKSQSICRQRGEFPNLILASFNDIDGIFMDYGHWHTAVFTILSGKVVSAGEKQRIFKPSWNRARWIRAARAGTHSVQLAAPCLPLDKARRVYVRNRQTRRVLAKKGFLDPVVLRIPVLRY